MSDGSAQWESPPDERRPRWPLVLGVLAAAALAGVAVRGNFEVDTAGGELEIDRDPVPDDVGLDPPDDLDTDASPLPPLEVLPGAWAELGPPPVGTGSEPQGVWTGNELVVLGDEGGVAAYDPAAGQWRVLPSLPYRQRSGQAVVWAEDEVVVVGGRDSAGSWHTNGAAYSPDADRWRAIPEAPVPAIADPVIVWTGTEVLIWGASVSPGREQHPVGAAYTPATDEWRRLPRPPALQPVRDAGGVWTDHGLVVWGHHDANPTGGVVVFAVLYDPETDEWEELERPPQELSSHAAGAWDEDATVYVWGARGGDADGRLQPTGVMLDLPTRRWHPMPAVEVAMPPDAPRPQASQDLAAVWAGEALIGFGGPALHSPLALIPGSPPWWAVPGGQPPNDVASPLAVWTGRRVLAWGGRLGEGTSPTLLAWRPRGSETACADRPMREARPSLQPAATPPDGAVALEGVPLGLEAAGSLLWTAVVSSDGTTGVVGVDPTTGEVVTRMPIGRGGQGWAVQGDLLWVTNQRRDSIVRLHVGSGEVQDEYPVGPLPSPWSVGVRGADHCFRPNRLAVSDGMLVVSTARSAIAWLDPDSGEHVAIHELRDHRTKAMPIYLAEPGRDQVWLATEPGVVVRVVVETGALERVASLTHRASGIRVVDGVPWVWGTGDILDGATGVLSRVDPLDGSVRSLRVDAPIAAVSDDGAHLFAADGIGRVWAVDPEQVEFSGLPVETGAHLTGLAVAPDGTLWGADQRSGSLRPLR